MSEAANAPDENIVQALGRGLDVIMSFDRQRKHQSLAQVSKHTGLPRATARRLLHTLINLGFAQTDGSDYWLTPRVLKLGYGYISAEELPNIAHPHMEALASALYESSSIGVLDGTEVVYIGRVRLRRLSTAPITIGTRFIAHESSIGRVILAGLSSEDLDGYFSRFTGEDSLDPAEEKSIRELLLKVREAGFAHSDQIIERGLRSVAAPIVDVDGQVIAGINVATSALYYDDEELEATIVPDVINTAQRISWEIQDARSAGGTPTLKRT